MLPPFYSLFSFRLWDARKLARSTVEPAMWLAKLDEVEGLADQGAAAGERLVRFLREARTDEDALSNKRIEEILHGSQVPHPMELTLLSELVCLASEALLWIGPPARDALLNAFAASNPEAPERWWYLLTLARMGDPELDSFFTALREGDVKLESMADPVGSIKRSHNRARAARELAAGGLETVYAAMTHPHEAWRSEAASFLGRHYDTRTVEALKRLLNDPSEAVQASARHNLEWVERVREHREQTVTGGAAAAQSDGGPRPLPPPDLPEFEKILFALENSDKLDRWRAADTLGSLGDARAIEPLRRQLHDPDQHVRQAAQEALARIEGP